MNTKPYRHLVFAACSLFMTGSVLSAQKPLTAAWLKAGCTALLVWQNDRENLTLDQQRTLEGVTPYVSGFIHGVQTMSFIGERGSNHKLTNIPYELRDFRRVAPKLMEFMQNFPVIDDSAEARMVLWAFWCFNHPEATEENKITGLSHLASTVKKDAAKE
jgi:hypothetical protein